MKTNARISSHNFQKAALTEEVKIQCNLLSATVMEIEKDLEEKTEMQSEKTEVQTRKATTSQVEALSNSINQFRIEMPKTTEAMPVVIKDDSGFPFPAQKTVFPLESREKREVINDEQQALPAPKVRSGRDLKEKTIKSDPEIVAARGLRPRENRSVRNPQTRLFESKKSIPSHQFIR